MTKKVIYRHYGDNKFDIEKFREISTCNNVDTIYQFTKPVGGN